MHAAQSLAFFEIYLRTCQELSTPSKSRAACLMVDTVMHSMLLNHELVFWGELPVQLLACLPACLLAYLPACMPACCLVLVLVVCFFLFAWL